MGGDFKKCSVIHSGQLTGIQSFGATSIVKIVVTIMNSAIKIRNAHFWLTTIATMLSSSSICLCDGASAFPLAKR